MKRVIIPIENYELDDYKTHKDGMKDYAYLILLISRKLISFPYLSEENINSISKPFLMMDICKILELFFLFLTINIFVSLIH